MRALIKNATFQLAENLLWHDSQYYFIDIDAMTLHRFKPTEQTLCTWQLDEKIGFFAIATDNNVILGLESGIYHFDLSSERRILLCHPLATHHLPQTVRYNDAKVSPDGDLWFASMDQSSPRQPVAALFCLFASGQLSIVAEDLRVGNGIAFDAANDRAYFSETDIASPQIYVTQYRKARELLLQNQRPTFATFVELDDDCGRPDGATVDTDGQYWSAGVSAGVINVFSKEGKLSQTINTPTNSPTCPCFGGDELGTLAFSSLRKTGSDSVQDGKLFYMDTNHKGYPTIRFNLDAHFHALLA